MTDLHVGRNWVPVSQDELALFLSARMKNSEVAWDEDHMRARALLDRFDIFPKADRKPARSIPVGPWLPVPEGEEK